jgi:hypothetical protein
MEAQNWTLEISSKSEAQTLEASNSGRPDGTTDSGWVRLLKLRPLGDKNASKEVWAVKW